MLFRSFVSERTILNQDSSYDKEVKDIHNSILFHQPVSMARCWGQMYEKNPVSRMPPTGFYGYLIENT